MAFPAFFPQSHWLYPAISCIAFLVRTFISSRVAGAIAPRLIRGRLAGVRKTFAMTALNVCCTAPIMCAIATLLISGADGFALRFATTLPITTPITVAVNFLVVGPIVKLAFDNCILPADGVNLLETLRSNATPLARLLGFE